jgi:flagellar hook-associated protein 1 FlgK
MSLFSSIQAAGNALQANQIGLQVVGQNIANANTPGYIREEAVFKPAPTQRMGQLLLGLGVEVEAIIQKIDPFVESRLRNANSDVASADAQESAFHQLEVLVGELSETDLSTSLNSFFNSIHEILNQPESLSIRNLAVLRGQSLTENIRRLSERVATVRQDLNDQVIGAADDINRLAEEIRRLNLQISEVESGDVSSSVAVGLRDQRSIALSELADLVTIRVDEQTNGTVLVSIDGTFLVTESFRREVEVFFTPHEGIQAAGIRFVDTQEPLEAAAGRVQGLQIARDEILGSFLGQLDDLAATLIFEFNRLFSSGQGLTGYQSLTSEFGVSDVASPLDAAGLAFTPRNGSFQVQVFNRQTGLTQTTDLFVDLDGLDDDDTTLADLAAALDAIDGVSASISSTRGLTITSDTTEQDFAFANDTSGILAALGINTFFTGTAASDIGVGATLIADPGKFAASRSGVHQDTDNAVDLAAFLDRPLDALNGATLSDQYDRLVGSVTQGSSVARATSEGFRVFAEALNGQHLALSGVSLDEEAVRLITYQRAFQATAKYIATLVELLEILVNL